MEKIGYTFDPMPRCVSRTGHGAINKAVLVALMSHGRRVEEAGRTRFVGIRVSAATLADEVGCDRKSIFPALDFWRGGADGVKLKMIADPGKSSGFEIVITHTENGTGGAGGKTVENKKHQYRKRDDPVPETVRPAVPKTERLTITSLIINDNDSERGGTESVGDVFARRKK